ncbi:hypothetical protein EDC01DRAFT_650595 [Geopyxis carbonaria]|nr:hypothetical protein EDC01DRAFT_650595 [Geopyxis carbonaria]
MDSILLYATPLFVVSLTFTIFLLSLPPRHNPSPNGTEKPHVVVLVLGDIGRSPRMQYHALSIARHGGRVSLVCYLDSAPRPELIDNPLITINALSSPPRLLDTSTATRFLFFAPLKALFQLISLLYMLLYTIPPTASHILLQNPPAIPTLAVTALVGRLRNQAVVIDWHNFGWSILRLKLRGHPLVSLAKFYEWLFARTATSHLAVTHSMTAFLRESWGITAPIKALHDRPPVHFQPFNITQRAEFLNTHPATKPYAARLLAGKAKLLVSATSWTADEDFSVLLEALVAYDHHCSSETFLRPGSCPEIVAIITGKGPLRDGYMARVETLEFQNITVRAEWLESADYPRLLACADLGVSLHTSSSGLDLPMKVVDLFGVGVPVVAMRFGCLGELVKAGENGMTFETGKELGELLRRLFDPRKARELEGLRRGAMKETGVERRWDAEWDKVAKGVLGFRD